MKPIFCPKCGHLLKRKTRETTEYDTITGMLKNHTINHPPYCLKCDLFFVKINGKWERRYDLMQILHII